MNQQDIIAAAWAELYERITDAIPNHAERKEILQKLTDIRSAERLEWSGKVEELRRRLDGKGAE